MKTISDVMMCAGCALPFIHSTNQMAARIAYLCRRTQTQTNT